MSRVDFSEQVPKDYRQIVRMARAAGWVATRTRQGHVKLTAPDGSYSMPIPGSSNSRRLRKSIVLRLRRYGLDVT